MELESVLVDILLLESRTGLEEESLLVESESVLVDILLLESRTGLVERCLIEESEQSWWTFCSWGQDRHLGGICWLPAVGEAATLGGVKLGYWAVWSGLTQTGVWKVVFLVYT